MHVLKLHILTITTTTTTATTRTKLPHSDCVSQIQLKLCINVIIDV